VGAPAPGPLRLLALGDDPIWAVWAQVAALAGATLEVASAAAPIDTPPPDAVLISPWWQAAPVAARRAVAAVRAGGGRADVWLVCTEPSPGLRAEVLAEGAVGCLPRLPTAELIARIGRLAAWRPVEAAVPLQPPEPEAASQPAGRATPVAVAAVVRRVGRLGLAAVAAWATAVAHAARGGMVRVRRAAKGAHRPAPVRLAARPAEPRGPRPAAAALPWWEWPAPVPQRSVALAVASALPDGCPVAAALLRTWAAHRGARLCRPGVAPPPGGGAGVWALDLGSPPPPERGRVHPRLRRARVAGAVAVVIQPDLAEMQAARTLVAALAALGLKDLRVWVVGDPVPWGTLADLSVALGVPCVAVPLP